MQAIVTNLPYKHNKVLNLCFFGLAFLVPFFTTFKLGGDRFGNFNHLFPVVALVFILNLKQVIAQVKQQKLQSNILNSLVIFFGLGIVSFLFEENHEAGLSQLINNAEFILILYALCFLLMQKTTIRYIYWGLLLSFLISVFIGSMQKLRIEAFYLYSTQELNANTIVENYTTTSFRVWGPFGNSLTFSLYLSVLGTLLFYYFKNVLKNTVVAYIIFTLTLYGIIITVSRTALFSFIATYAIMEFLLNKARGRIIFIALFSGVLVFILLAGSNLPIVKPLIDRALSSSEDLQSGRVDLWIIGIQVWMEHFFFGVGPGDLGAAVYKHGYTRGADVTFINSRGHHLENYFLTMLVTYGFVPFLFFARHIFYSFKDSYKAFKWAKKDASLAEGIPLIGALVAFAINNVTNPILLTDPRIQMLYFLIIAQIVFLNRNIIFKNNQIKDIKKAA